MQPTSCINARIARLGSTIALAALLPGFAFAAWQQGATIRMTGEYESNPALTSNAAADIRRVLLEPGYSLTGHFDNDEYRAGLSLLAVRTTNQQVNPDRDNPAAFLEWLHQGENDEMGINIRYSEVSTREVNGAEATAQGTASSVRASRMTGVKWTKALSERTGFIADAAQESVFYRNGNFINYLSRSASALIHHDLNEQTAPYARLLYSDYMPDNTQDFSRLQSAAIGVNLATSEQLSGSAEVGRADAGNDQIITQGSLAVQYAMIQSAWNVSASRRISPSGLGGYAIVNQAAANWRYDLSERNSTGIDISWQRSQSASSITIASAEGTRKTGGIWIMNQLAQNWQLRTYLTHNILENSSTGTAYSNLTGITLTYTRPDF